jgi:hypothetical protein
MKSSLTKCLSVAASAALFSAGILTSAFAGPERIDSKDKMIMAPPVCDPRWYVSLGGSVDFDIGSDFASGFTAEPIGAADVTIVSRDYDNTFEGTYNIQGEVGYVLTNHIELFGTFRYTHAESKIVTGSVSDFGFFDLEYVSQYGDYDSFGGELGLRYYFLPKDAKIRPYVSVSGGAAFVDSIGLRADSEFFGTNITFYDDSFYDDSIVASISGLVGVEFNVTCHLAVGIDAGLRWQSELEDDDAGFDRAIANSNSNTERLTFQRLKDINDEGSRITVPVTVYAKFRF